MLYDVGLEISYDYEAPVAGGRHILRLMPLNQPGTQRLVAGTLTIAPKPADREEGRDFFGNAMTAIAYRDSHSSLRLRLQARVSVEPETDLLDMSSRLADLPGEIAAERTLAADAPHHFLAPSPRVPQDAAIARWARERVQPRQPVREIARALSGRIFREFAYDTGATRVESTPREAFALRRGVCQDFAHVMIAGLRGVGIPAAYVSGYLRTLPPPGQERLAGADAMHAWVRVWCGAEAGWIGFDPTNDVEVGRDHIAVATGRDYADVAPVIGVLRTFGSHRTTQAVDVVPVG
jgi:transglutaminase-like putative cysteine protease